MERPYQIRKVGKTPLIAAWPCFGVVGSRDASPKDLKTSQRIARSLVHQGFVVASGLARGVDTAAHVGAMMAGGHTMAFIASDFDVVYPPENRALHEEIAQNHMLVSVAEPGQVCLGTGSCSGIRRSWTTSPDWSS